MFLAKISLRNFGSFESAEFNFWPSRLNVIQGQNGAGKSQLAGAALAAVVGRAAIKIDKAGVGPSQVCLSLSDGDTIEDLTLTVSVSAEGDALVQQASTLSGASHSLGPLALRLLTAISDPTGPRLLLRRDIDSAMPDPVDLDVIERSLPDGLKQDEVWLQLRSAGELRRMRSSGGQLALGMLLWEFARRQRDRVHLPLIVDEFLWVLPDDYVDFSIKLLEAIAARSQVLLLTHAVRNWDATSASVLSLDGVESRVHSLTYYNYFIERQRPAPTRPRQLKWVRGSTFPNQENRWCELKEVKGANPIGSIKSVVDQYAVAYLNAGLSRAGAIFWGVRNEDLVIIGVNLSNRQCDELRRIVIEKLHQITPPLAPTAYEIYLHPVSDGGRYVPDLYLVEVRIPPARRTFLFSTGNQEVYVKTDAGKKKLSALEIQQELLKRLSIDPSF